MEFSRWHPMVNLIYYVAVISISVFLMHPALLGISSVAAFLLMLILQGRKNAVKSLALILPLSILAAVLNVVFNHRGITILAYFPNGNAITMEALLYGANTSLMIAAVIWWFSSFCEVMTSDKLICLFGKVIPSLSLIFSMVLRFVPRLKKQLQLVSASQKALGVKTHSLKGIASIMSAVTTWAVEGSVLTSDSMKARGFGVGKRTSYSAFRFTKSDLFATLYIILLSVYIIAGRGSLKFEFYPYISYSDFTFYQATAYAAFLLLAGMPLFLELVEVLRWKYLRSKI